MMKTNNYLLPYSCQKAGWVCLIAVPLLFAATLPVFNTFEWIEQTYSRFASSILYLLLFLGVFFIALSREKEEDEMIRELRVSSIAITFYIAIVTIFLSNIFMTADHALRFIKHREVVAVYRALNNVVTFFFIYIVIYKVRLWRSRFEVNKEEKR